MRDARGSPRRDRPREGPAAGLRLFVAVELPPAVRESIGALQDELKREGLPLRWVRPEGVHLTLRFIGPAQPERLEVLERSQADAVPPFDAFALRTAEMGVFGGNRARVLWVGLAGDLERLARLQRAVDAGIERAGVAPAENERFSPHLTLARVTDTADAGERRRIHDLAAATTVASVAFEVSRLALIRSRLGPGGAQYETLMQFPA